MRETDLYAPVKAFLEAQGYDVKGEVGDCDVFAVRDTEPPVIVELKTSFSLDLVFQGVERQKLSDDVYLAAPPVTGRAARRRHRDIVGLCRRLGLGLMAVSVEPSPLVDVILDPAPYTPKKRKARQGRLLGEFQRRVGDPTPGGADKKRPRMTAYRQDALRCALHLSRHGPAKASVAAEATGVVRARTILYSDHYGWFERVETGIYQITPKGAEALALFADIVEQLDANAG